MSSFISNRLVSYNLKHIEVIIIQYIMYAISYDPIFIEEIHFGKIHL